MQVKYKVCVYDFNGNKVEEITNFTNLVIVHTVNSNGYCNVILDGDSRGVDAFVERDYIVEIYRSVPDAGLDWYIEFEGLYRTGVYQTYVTGKRTFAAYSLGFLDLLRRRVIAYYAGTWYTSKSEAAESAMKSYVRYNAAEFATSPPRISNGVTPNLVVADSLGTGATWTGSKAFRNLLEALQEISKDTGDTFFDIVKNGDTPGNFIFKTYPNVRGTDRRFYAIDPNTGLNPAGNAPITFSTRVGNAFAAMYSHKTSDEINVVYGLGQGEEQSRLVAVVTDPASILKSPWNRSEATRSATNENSAYAVRSVATAYLNEMKEINEATFEYQQIPSCVYGKDFWWGDFVTVRYDDIFQEHKMLLGCTISANDENHETILLDMADTTTW